MLNLEQMAAYSYGKQSQLLKLMQIINILIHKTESMKIGPNHKD